MNSEPGAVANELDIEDICPLSPVQEAMLYQYILNPSDMRYREQAILKLQGTMDREILERAISHVTRRRDILRSVIVHEGVKEPVQLIMNQVKIPVDFSDFTDQGIEVAEAHAALSAQEELDRSFNLSRGPLLRLRLIKTGSSDFTLIITFHHIIIDGWSLGLFLGDLIEAYIMEAMGQEPAWAPVTQFSDYLEWIGNKPVTDAESFWNSYMDGSSPQPPLFDRSRKDIPASYGGVGGRTRQEFRLSPELSAGLRRLALASRSTMANLLKVLWGITVCDFTECDDIVYGFVTAGRPPSIKGIETAIGCFLATIPVRFRLGGFSAFRDLAQEMQKISPLCEEMSYLPLSSMTGTKTPNFDHLVVFENYPQLDGGRDTGVIRIKSIEGIERAPYPLNIVFADNSNLISMTIAYDDELYLKQDIESIFRVFESRTMEYVNNPDLPVINRREKTAVKIPGTAKLSFSLVNDFERSVEFDINGERTILELGSSLIQALKDSSRKYGLEPIILYLTAWTVLIEGLSGQEVLTLSISDRNNSSYNSVLVLETDKRQAVQFFMKQLELKLNGIPWFISNLDNMTGWQVESTGDVSAILEYRTTGQVAGYYKRILENLADNISQLYGEIEILTEDERRTVLEDWNRTDMDFPSSSCIHKLFEDQVKRTPNSVAVSFRETRLSYQELNKRANIIAQQLIEMGIGPDGMVAICLDRSLELVIAILGVLKAGGAYIPLDSGYPLERLQYMLEDSSASVIIASSGMAAKLDGNRPALDPYNINFMNNAENPFIEGLGADNLAYILYTSGSTGNPKGAMIEHRNLVNHMSWMNREFPLKEGEAVIQKTPVSFDASVWEFYAPLLQGGRLVMADPELHKNPEALVRLMKKERVHTLQGVPSLIKEVLEVKEIKTCSELKRVFSGGEVLTPQLKDRFFEIFPDASLINLYGPAECTIDTVYWICSKHDRKIPIGRPVDNTCAYILDEFDKPVPTGVAGQLCLSGASVSRGYINRPRLNSERFIKDPFKTGQGIRMYKTGDICRWNPEGVIEFVGRNDHQIKLRGFRIELEEIESSIMAQKWVRECAVVVKNGAESGQWICAYVASSHDAEPESSENIASALGTALPDYMIPARFIFLEALPKTDNGKIDRKALVQREDHLVSGRESRRPRDIIEEEVLEAAKKTLGINDPAPGMDDDFFAIGGDSLKAIRLYSLLAYGPLFGIQDIYETRTLEKMAERIRQRKEELARSAHAGMKPSLPPITSLFRAARDIVKYRKNRMLDHGQHKHMDRTVLLTGATGWVGIHLLENLLENTEWQIIALVRGNSVADAYARLETVYLSATGKTLSGNFRKRLKIVQGDITMEDLGLGTDMNFCVNEVTDIIHSAAMVSHYGHWESFYEINVRPVERLLELCIDGQKKNFHLISTMSIAAALDSRTIIFTEESSEFMPDASNLYVRSKVMAEELALRAKEKDIDVWIYRLGNVVCDSRNGIFQRNMEDNAFYRMLNSFIKLGAIPDIPFANYDFTYADKVADVVEIIIKKGKPDIYHIINPEKTGLKKLAELFSGEGYPVRPLKRDDFIKAAEKALNEPGKADAAAAILAGFSADRPSVLLSMSDRTNKFLTSHKMEWPELDSRLFRLLLSYGIERDFFPDTKGALP